MDRSEWLKAVYLAACRVAEKHGSGLRAAVESAADANELRQEIQQVAAATIAASSAIWPFITFSAHPEPAEAEWRGAPSFEGAAVRVAVAALAADIQDLLENLAASRALGLRAEPAAPDAGPSDQPEARRRPGSPC